MSYQHFYQRASLTVAFLFLLLVMHGQSWAETGQDQLQKKVARTIEVRQKTQEKEDAWARTKSELTACYRSLKANQEHLKKTRVKTKNALAAQNARVEELERRIEESARIREELQSCLESVATRLEEFIKKDLPFQSKERGERLASIKETLARPDKPAAEKYRRVMEALQIETEYGRTVEVYQDSIDLDDQSVLVDILKLGRLSLFCQTPDSKIMGHYDRAAKAWARLPSKYHRDIGKAIEMARHERAIDLVKLSIGRIIPGKYKHQNKK